MKRVVRRQARVRSVAFDPTQQWCFCQIIDLPDQVETLREAMAAGMRALVPEGLRHRVRWIQQPALPGDFAGFGSLAWKYTPERAA